MQVVAVVLVTVELTFSFMIQLKVIFVFCVKILFIKI